MTLGCQPGYTGLGATKGGGSQKKGVAKVERDSSRRQEPQDQHDQDKVPSRAEGTIMTVLGRGYFDFSYLCPESR